MNGVRRGDKRPSVASDPLERALRVGDLRELS